MTMVRALARRDLLLYFSNPTGYVFITAFIFLSASAAFWQDRFFLQNLANLDQLNAWFSVLLLFFIPAMTMNVWSDERRLGTDELLLTLPATDLEIVLGKYAASLGVYVASLLLALSFVAVLFYLGSPDLGLMFSNYLGYALSGAALIAVGMLASQMARNATVAFIIGMAFCGVLVLGMPALALTNYFDDFAKGVISLSGVLYLTGLAAFFLYLNVLVLGRRHWPPRADGYPMWAHHLVRATALAVALVSVVALVARANVRLDATAEGLHTLSDETLSLIAELPANRPVFIRAFVSPAVPESYVQTRSNLISLLEEIDGLAGNRVEVLIDDTEAFSDAAREARETYGIVPRTVRDIRSARSEVVEVFLGLAFTCGAEEQVIGFFDRGLPAEYEIMRGIRVVARTERRRIGVVKTMMDIVGGVNYQQNEFKPQWPVVTELRKQYEVLQLDPDYPIADDLDGVLVPLPSSLQSDQLQHLTDYIEAGGRALLLVDPLPAVDPTLSPSEWAGEGNPFTYPPGTARPGPRGNVREWMRELGVGWEPTRILWDNYNPHPDLAHLQSEFVFLGAGSGNDSTFNRERAMTAQLQELLLPFAGYLEPVTNLRINFEPLLRTSAASGTNGYFSLVTPSPFGPRLNPSPPREQDDQDYVVAAHVESADGWELIVVADLDFIGQQFFAIREQAPGGLNFDNVTFFLNAIDTLVGDDSFIDLRSRRARHRTLERLEAQTAEFVEQRTADEQAAEAEAEEALAQAQARLDERVEALKRRGDIDAQTMQIMVRNLEQVENRRLEVLSTTIQTDKAAKVQASRETMEARIRKIQTTIKSFAILLPPVPVLVGGIAMFLRRRRREREGAALAHQLREGW